MNFIKGSLFRRNTEPEELEPVVESGGGVLAVWGSPGCGKTVTAVKIWPPRRKMWRCCSVT